jgi:glycosyltransferase involved in cell wall biosynthesis
MSNFIPKSAILHYSAPPIVGGVEGVIQAHCQIFIKNSCQVSVIAGRGDENALPKGTKFHQVPVLDTQHPEILELSSILEQGQIPSNFEAVTQKISRRLKPILTEYDNLIVHNVFTKHFNIPLTTALINLVHTDTIKNCIAWCHDFTWTSPNSRSRVYEGYPWDLLRKYNPKITYVTVSKERQRILAQLFDQSDEKIQVVYNGVDPRVLLGFSQEGYDLIQRLDVFNCDLILLMPVRVTQAKNIEYAIQLLIILKQRGIKPKLIHTGPPDPHSDKSMEYFRNLQKMRSDYGLGNNMHFVFESGTQSIEGYQVGLDVVGDLYRISDLVIMPSHREGFGMPVLEAGLVGIPAICTPKVPAAVEIGCEDITLFDASDNPDILADQIQSLMKANPQYRFKRRVRESFSWDAIFKRNILPLLRDSR